MTAAAPLTFSFADPEELADSLATSVAAQLHRRLADREEASLVVSGGSTPGPLFQRLAGMELPWERVVITLADERWVAPNHEASNERLVRFLLLQDKASRAAFVPLKNKALTARAGADECCRSLARIRRPWTVVLLGMGLDGHTASLIPGAADLGRAMDPDADRDCLAIAPRHAPFERITLTLSALLRSEQIFLHLTGRDKKRVLRQAMAAGPAAEMPVRAILRQRQTPVHIYWSP